MNTVLQLAFKSLLNRKFTVGLTTLSIGLSVMLLLGVERIRSEARDSFASTVSGTDLIVGARGSPTQILLFSVFNLGYPTKNIAYDTYLDLAQLDATAWVIPLAMGDSHRGYRVVGTAPHYFEHFKIRNGQSLQLASGEFLRLDQTFDAVLGSEVAQALNYPLGSKIVVAHGTGDLSFVEHDEHPFSVVGILEPTGTPVDQLILVPLDGIAEMHHGFYGEAGHAGHHHHDFDPLGDTHGQTVDHAHLHVHEPHSHDVSLSALLVGLENRAAALAVQRYINEFEEEPLTAVLPGVTLQELWGILGVIENTLLLITGFVVLVGLSGMLTALLTSLNERRREMAVLRSVGARPGTIFSLLVGEAALITGAGIALGIALLYLGLFIGQPILQDQLGIFLSIGLPAPREVGIIGLVAILGLGIGFIPAWRIYRVSLADGVTPRL
jgi:putative ABC transport system permease protein